MQHSGAQPDVQKLRSLIALMQRRGLSRLVLIENGVSIRLEAAPPTAVDPDSPAAAAYHAFAPPLPAPPPVEEPPTGVPLVSPTTGAFYRAPAPGEPPFVEVGDEVETGQTVGIIMAMKVMSEIPAEIGGIVVAIPAADGALVQTGDPLVVVQPLD